MLSRFKEFLLFLRTDFSATKTIIKWNLKKKIAMNTMLVTGLPLMHADVVDKKNA